MARILSPGNFGLLQHNLPKATECTAAKLHRRSITSSAGEQRRAVRYVLKGEPRAIGSSELGEAVADGPILFCGIENGHEHVLRADAGSFAEQLRDPPEQRFLLFHSAG